MLRKGLGFKRVWDSGVKSSGFGVFGFAGLRLGFKDIGFRV